MAWEHGGTDFQSRFDKSTEQAQELKEKALRCQSNVAECQDKLCSRDYWPYVDLFFLRHPGVGRIGKGWYGVQ
jgi:hypothetical protein